MKEKPSTMVPSGTGEATVFWRLKMRRKRKIMQNKATASITPSSLRIAELASFRLATRALRS
ncbi:hypothetical protein CYLTODRAFT_323104, partial [Cylindrobasidium torrendii FP15055 ss-10]